MTEVVKVAEWTLLAGLHNCRHRPLTNAANSPETINHSAVFYREAMVAVVDTGWTQRQLHTPYFFDEHNHSINVLHIS